MPIRSIVSMAAGALGLAALSFAVPANSQALVTSQGALGPTDSIGWAQLGPTFTTLTTPQGWTSVGGATGEVGIDASTIGTTNMERRDEGNGWLGNFNVNDALLWNQDTTTGNGNVLLLFNTPVTGAGAQIGADPYGAFTGHVTAFLSGGGTESFSEAGVETAAEDGSAIFIGILDPTADIEGIEFGTTDINGGNTVAVDTVYLNSGVAPAGTPEPGALALFTGMAVSGVFAVVRRKRRAC